MRLGSKQPIHPLRHGPSWHSRPGHGGDAWTFAGTRANRTTAKQIQSLVEVRRVDAVGLDLKTPIDLGSLSTDVLKSEIVFSDNEIMELAKSVKFSECLPIVFLGQIVRLRQFDGFLKK